MSTSRYDLIPNNTRNLKDGTIVYNTILYPTITPSPTDVYIFAVKGQRLDTLAAKYYNDPTLWWIISHANKIKGTLMVPEDTQLWIPMDINTINSNLVELNS